MKSRRPVTRATRRHAKVCLAISLSHVVRALLIAIVMLSATAPAIAATNVLEYTYDAAGNIVRIQRQTAPGFAITGFDPASGAVGTVVTVYGMGFSATTTDNTVRFNGTAATVSASDSGSISTTVPTGASTGRITVTVNGATATSATDFVVTIPGAPTINSLTPASGAAGMPVDVAGTNFEIAAGATTVKLNGVTAAATVTSSTVLNFQVPAAAASGKVTATTASGTGTSVGDFIVPPPGMVASDIVSSARLVTGGANGNVFVGTPGKSALALFDAQPNVYYSIHFAGVAIDPSTATVTYKIIKPDNTVLSTGSIGTTNRPSIHLPLLTAGTYSILLSPGNATLNANLRVEINPSVTVDGPAANSSLDFAYQSARFVFAATANQRIGIGIVGLAFTPAPNSSYNTLRVFRPDGTEITPPPMTCGGKDTNNPEGNCDGELLAPVGGTYTAIFECPSNAYGNFGLQLNSEVVGTLAPDSTQAISLGRVGQDARFTFTGNAGDSLGIDLSNAALVPTAQTTSLNVYKPDGTFWKQASARPPRSIYTEMGTLPTTGSYSAFIDPSFGAYGTLNLTLKQGPMLQPTDPAVSFAPPGASETARFRFTAVAGQGFSVGVSGLTYVGSGPSTYMTIYGPNGSSVGAGGTCNVPNGYCRAWVSNLAQGGTYSVVLVPPDGVKISGNIVLSSDLTGTLTAGSPVWLTGRVGQIARYTFAGTAGDSTMVKLYGLATTPSGQGVSLAVQKPDGTYLQAVTVYPAQAGAANLPSLPITGNYTVVVDPGGASWQGTLALDAGTATTINAPIITPVSAAGEVLRYTFPATSGQRVELGFTGLAYTASSTAGTNVNVYTPSGSSVMSFYCYTTDAGCETFTANAPATGTYTMLLTPPGSVGISAGNLALSVPLPGTFVVGDPAQVVAIARPGQSARYTFSGTAAQLLRLNWTSPSISGATFASVSVLKPDGTALSSSNYMNNGVSSGFDLLSLPATGTYTVVIDPPSAATMSASMALVTR